jgi:epoxyqueuosine reductase
MNDAEDLAQQIKARCSDAGFAASGICQTSAIPDARRRLMQALAAGWHGDMGWLAETAERRSDPRTLWPEARSAIVVASRYGARPDGLAALADGSGGLVSGYAEDRDYHDTVKPALKRVARWLAESTGAGVKVFVDTAPLMEKPLAQAAGLGWQGKHTNLVSRDLGSWFFLGVILTDLVLPADGAEPDHCGTCQRCLDICPTNAFPAPYQLDARRCIAYLTIEHKGPIAPEFRVPIGNRVFGCDDCLTVCPWNKFAQAAPLTAAPDRLADLLTLDDIAFRARFRGTPVKRTGRDRFLRNVCIAAGNSGDIALVPSLLGLLDDPSPLVRGMAIWALARLAPVRAANEAAARRSRETDADVRAEWADVIAVRDEHA